KSRDRGQSSTQMKGIQYYNCSERGHFGKDCLSEKKIKNDKIGMVFNIRNEFVNQGKLKRSDNPNWNNRLKDRKLTKTTRWQKKKEGRGSREE
ncbi:797_t:CDS:2, partial [Gigaspora rosea]